VADAVIAKMGAEYPELERKAGWIREVIVTEEARFARTIESGLAILDEVIARVRAAGGSVIDGEDVFRLYDTYGFPPDLTRVVAEEQGLGIDQPGFDAAMHVQRERARAGGHFTAGAGEAAYRRLGLDDVIFLGYDATEADGRVVMLVVDGEPTVRAAAGTVVEIVLDQTPFYAESGGQVGDTGLLVGPDGRVRITDTRKPVAGLTVHHGIVEAGALTMGDMVTATVDADRRLDIMRNHTATHLLHRALQEVLGEHAQQRGSLVAPDRLRFDFAHLAGLSDDELERIEARVNELVREDLPVAWSLLPLDEARKRGAMMLFGEKYGDIVRVIDVGGGVSRELCGGTHLARTGQIGAFVVSGESSVGAGLRRIEALTGVGAEGFIRERLRLLRGLAGQVGAQSAEGIEAKVDDLLHRNREQAREVTAARAELAGLRAGSLMDGRVDVGGVAVLAARVEAADAAALRGQVTALIEQLGDGVVVLGAVIDGQPRVVAAVSDASVAAGLHAGQLVKAVAADLGGGGGGRPNMAEAGGRDAGALDAALAAVAERVRGMRGG
jgi:alanyl-tRNA synthetase